ncbi:hypothetical protein JVU11DRAFT_6769 [Chiua virens]|nr:hypothetical protein JVU11DRAFT_6769 [Chiua virens]
MTILSLIPLGTCYSLISSTILTMHSQNNVYRGFQEFLKFFPWIKPKLMESKLADLELIFKDHFSNIFWLRKGGDDAASLKKEVMNWLTELYAPIIPPILPTLKSDHGLDHDVTGHLLCPIEVRKNVREHHPQFVVSERSWPRFLYDTRQAYNPDNIEKGLFKSTLLLKAFKLIFTSPTSAQEVTIDDPTETRRRTHLLAKKTTHSHVASLIGMCTLRFTLSTLTFWGAMDGDFHAPTFYNNIVTYFEAPPGPVAKKRVQELSLWWDRYVVCNPSFKVLISCNRKVFGFHQEMPHVPEYEATLSVAQMDNQRAAAEVPAVPGWVQ